MIEPIVTSFNYTYKRTDEDVWVLNFNDIPVDNTKIKEQQIAHLSPKSIGGNHKHARTEWFVAIGELVFHWLDEQGQLHSQDMNPDGKLLLFEVPAYLPHAVENSSDSHFAVLYEMTDGREGVEEVSVYEK